MENFIADIMLPSLICGAVFCAMGAYMYYFPPKEINYLYGYRTGASMKSKERWDFAQKFSAMQMVKGGAAMLLLSLLSYFVPVATEVKMTLGMVLLFCCVAYLIFTTEKAIKNKFQN